jgi:hypothetical protein
MIETSPKGIEGEWASGYALDFHILSSEYLGGDEYGRPRFDTKWSDRTYSYYESENEMIRVFFGGPRKIERLSKEMKERTDSIIANGYLILLGDANGADKAMQKYLSE